MRGANTYFTSNAFFVTLSYHPLTNTVIEPLTPHSLPVCVRVTPQHDVGPTKSRQMPPLEPPKQQQQQQHQSSFCSRRNYISPLSFSLLSLSLLSFSLSFPHQDIQTPLSSTSQTCVRGPTTTTTKETETSSQPPQQQPPVLY